MQKAACYASCHPGGSAARKLLAMTAESINREENAISEAKRNDNGGVSMSMSAAIIGGGWRRRKMSSMSIYHAARLPAQSTETAQQRIGCGSWPAAAFFSPLLMPSPAGWQPSAGQWPSGGVSGGSANHRQWRRYTSHPAAAGYGVNWAINGGVMCR